MQMCCKYRTNFINATVLQKIILLLFLTLVWSSCNRDADDVPPLITVFSVNSVDTLATAIAGNTTSIAIGFTDNDQLQQYRLSLFDDFGSLNISGASNYSHTEVTNVSGGTVNQTVDLVIPSTANSGPYWVTLTVVDASGNAAAELAIDLWMTNSNQAAINLANFTSPVNVTDTIWFAGTVDDDDLDQVNLKITDVADVSYYNHTFDYSDSTVTTWNFNTMTSDSVFAVTNSTYVSGTYNVTITALDHDGNYTELVQQLIVN